MFSKWGRVVGLLLAALVGLGTLPSGVAARPAADTGYVAGVPWVRQWYSLTCEYATVASVTWYYGNLVSQRTLINEMPYAENPHNGFRGRINGPVGGTTDYGIYAEPFVPLLQQHGFNAQAVYGNVGWLKAQIVADRPVMVWMTYQTRPSTRQYATSNGVRYLLVPGEHTAVVTAYDDWGLTVMDPYTGTFPRYSWADFTRAWGYFDNMALLITPGP